LHPPSESTPIARWPKIPAFVFASSETLPAPSSAGLNAELPRPAPLPRWATARPGAESLPVPDRELFQIKEGSLEVLLSTTASRRAATKLALVNTANAVLPKAAKGHNRTGASRAQTARPGAKRAAQSTNASDSPRPTRLAGLKKQRPQQ
jgi:hypothetical protein